MKETQEGCLSRSINDFFECSLFKKVALSGAKRLFRHAEGGAEASPFAFVLEQGRSLSLPPEGAKKSALFPNRKRAKGSICAGEWNDRMGRPHAADGPQVALRQYSVPQRRAKDCRRVTEEE